MINPCLIPVFTGNFENLEKAVSGLRSDAIGIRDNGSDIHGRFQALAGVYIAPEAEDLFATTQPVADKSDGFAAKLETVADALDTFLAEARPLAKRLDQLKVEATEFVNSVAGDDDWRNDGDKVDQHNEIDSGVRTAMAAFQEAERRAANKIAALVGDVRFVAGTGGDKVLRDKDDITYGFTADVYKKAKELPWGSPVSESHEWYELHHHAKTFVWDGIVIDNIVGTLRGLGTLVGVDGFDKAGQAWKGLGDVFGGISQYLMTPYDEAMDAMLGEDGEGDEKRQKDALKGFTKSLVAWDQWDENPVRAAATVTFNGLTLGAGPLSAASKAGQGGAFAKAAGTTARVGAYLDPVYAGVAGTSKAAKALPRLSEVTSGLRAGGEALTSPQRLHTVWDLGNGHKVRIEDGEFIRLDAEGKPLKDTAPHEKTADERAASEQAPPQHEPVLVGAGVRTPGDAIAAGDNLPPQASHNAPGHDAGSDTRGVPGQAPRSNGGSDASGGQPSAGHDRSGNATDARTGGPHSPQNAGGGVGHAGRAGQDTPVPPGDHSSGADDLSNASKRELTSAELKVIQDEHVRKANENPTWFKQHYDILGRRRPNIGKVDGAELPQLAKNAQGQWVAKHDLPNGPSETRFGSKPLARDTAPREILPTLDNAAANREAYRDLMNAQKAYEETPSVSNRQALTAAQDAYTQRLGDVPPNSKISEKFGEKASQLHVIPREFEIVETIDLPKTPNGANMFDGAYRLKDDQILIAEDKAPGNDLDWRQGRADPEDPNNPGVGDNGGAAGMRVKQGTRPYLRTILAEMTKRGGRDAELAREFREALKAGKLKYVLVTAKDPEGSRYAGAVLEHLKIY